MEAVNLALEVRPRCACIMSRTRQKRKNAWKINFVAVQRKSWGLVMLLADARI
jgi:hypothetical protein